MMNNVRRTAAGLVALALFAAPGARAQSGHGLRAGVAYSQSRFSSDLEPWHLATLEVAAQGAAGTALLRANAARRFAISGVQLEAEAYPRLTERAYAFLNVGASSAEIFPALRMGAELYVMPVDMLELSGGVHHLDFRTEDVTLLTGSAGVYQGNLFAAVRPVLALVREDRRLAVDLLVRRYLRDADEHLTLRLGGGATPTETFTTAELNRVDAARVAVEAQTPIGEAVHLRLLAGFEHEQLPEDRERDRLTLGVGVVRRF